MARKEPKTYEEMTIRERIITTTSSKLLKHFRGLEDAGTMDRATTANFIGCIKKLTAIANGEGDENPETHESASLSA